MRHKINKHTKHILLWISFFKFKNQFLTKCMAKAKWVFNVFLFITNIGHTGIFSLNKQNIFHRKHKNDASTHMFFSLYSCRFPLQNIF